MSRTASISRKAWAKPSLEPEIMKSPKITGQVPMVEKMVVEGSHCRNMEVPVGSGVTQADS